MFLYREKELNTLSIDGNVIVYGKRRVGKTSLIKEYIQSSGKTYYYFECLKTSLFPLKTFLAAYARRYNNPFT